MSGPLEVAILWHMHQPDYRDRRKGRAVLPWVRLHAVKDYFPMAALVDEFPALRVNFNCVPSLLDQLDDYLAGRTADEHLVVSSIPAAELDDKSQLFLLRNFFMANHDTMIRPLPRYLELLERRGPSGEQRHLEGIRRSFAARDYLDLQVLFNLAWFGPYFLAGDPLCRELVHKGGGYTEAEKKALLERQREIAGQFVPLLRRLAGEGRIEISSTPFYHPILPLLIDTDCARVAMPEVALPRRDFRHPEDALAQVRKALAYHEATFGTRPQGMWPSEGSVSPAVLRLLEAEGVRWTATDENILFRSLGLSLNQDFYRSGRREGLLYQPFRAEQGTTAVFFRDHVLSDLVGFSYSRWEPRDAVADFVHRLRGIAAQEAGPREGRVVSVILDGENAWEYYPDGGLEFIRGLYHRLCEDADLRSTTFSGHLARFPVTATMREIFTGSWINNNFAIWIGHREDVRAWELLAEAREALVGAQVAGAVPAERILEAWEELYMAEGSDWCWWYGDDHTSGNDDVFDELYRRHLRSVYELIGQEPPESVLASILESAGGTGPTPEEVTSLISPRIDGLVSSYFEWLGAAVHEVHRRGQTMQRAEVPVSSFHYGIGTERLFLRLDFRIGYRAPGLAGDALVVHVARPRQMRIVVPLGGGGSGAHVIDEVDGTREELRERSVALEEILEMGIPWKSLKASLGQEVRFHLSLTKDGGILTSWPMSGSFAVVVPGEDFERRMWSV
ncbi:MAG TPA: glycoside hydrolase family 57 protein [Candidatus Methanoperedens sp.]|nr:glycoside hydrolase family 57 protein [Candidatus Methanoperedens sp.]